MYTCIDGLEPLGISSSGQCSMYVCIWFMKSEEICCNFFENCARSLLSSSYRALMDG